MLWTFSWGNASVCVSSFERTLAAPNMEDAYHLNLLDRGNSTVLTIVLGDTMYLWDASDGSASP